jgi:hypothetical protein
MDIKIRIAEREDSESIYELLHYWYLNYYNEDKSLGHTYSEVTWTLEDIKRTIEESIITVADWNGKVVSFYLINTFLEIGNVQIRTKIINGLIEKKTLPEGKYAFSLSAATHPDFLRKGLNTKVLNLLKDLSKHKYDFFVGIMAYDNAPTQKSSLKMGWKHFGDIGIGLLAVTGTTEERNLELQKYLDRL